MQFWVYINQFCIFLATLTFFLWIVSLHFAIVFYLFIFYSLCIKQLIVIFFVLLFYYYFFFRIEVFFSECLSLYLKMLNFYLGILSLYQNSEIFLRIVRKKAMNFEISHGYLFLLFISWRKWTFIFVRFSSVINKISNADEGKKKKKGYALWMFRGIIIIMQSFYISQKACNISFLQLYFVPFWM